MRRRWGAWLAADDPSDNAGQSLDCINICKCRLDIANEALGVGYNCLHQRRGAFLDSASGGLADFGIEAVADFSGRVSGLPLRPITHTTQCLADEISLLPNGLVQRLIAMHIRGRGLRRRLPRLQRLSDLGIGDAFALDCNPDNEITGFRLSGQRRAVLGARTLRITGGQFLVAQNQLVVSLDQITQTFADIMLEPGRIRLVLRCLVMGRELAAKAVALRPQRNSARRQCCDRAHGQSDQACYQKRYPVHCRHRLAGF